jgi:alpha-tubulin suppressor-like RCC1 family protein
MKKLLLFLIFPLALHAQLSKQVKEVILGEYNTYGLVNGQLEDFTATPAKLLVGQPAMVIDAAASLHHFGLIDGSGNVYMWGVNTVGEAGNGTAGTTLGTPTQILVDSLGNPFTGIVQVLPFSPPWVDANTPSYGTLFVKKDGTLWITGTTDMGKRGNNTWGGRTTRPVQIPFPAGVQIKRVQANDQIVALDQNGNVWTLGDAGQYSAPYLLGQGNNPTPLVPTKISLPVPATDIIGGGYVNYVTLSSGKIYAFGFTPQAMGFPANTNQFTIPTDVTPYVLPAGESIAKVALNSESSYLLTKSGKLIAWGDNACGTIGNGQELNYATYVNSQGQSKPYAWDWAWGRLIAGPTQVATGIANVWGAPADVFYVYAQDSAGNLYSWGRNKAFVLGNGYGLIQTSAVNDATYPNWGDVTKPTRVTPLDNTTPIYISSPGGMPAVPFVPVPPIVAYTPPANKPPVAILTGPTSVTLPSDTLYLDGAASADSDGLIATYSISQISGPPCVLVQSGAKATAYATASGIYTYRLTVVDNSGASSSTTLSVTVNPYPVCPPPVVCPAPRNVSTVTVSLFGTTITIPASAIVNATYQ